MAKKTKMKKQIKRRNAEIAKVFDCPFCHQKKSVRMKVYHNLLL